jgi:nicotinate-nucleotide adenylyltransferase
VKGKERQAKRIGIYAGTFNPVHTGHITFALQAVQKAKLDGVVFLPERQPRFKSGVEHFGHRVAMLKRAVKPHPDLAVLELVDRNFTVRRTWPQLQAVFPDATIVMLMGSDAAPYLPDWPLAEMLIKDTELIIGVRESHDVAKVVRAVRMWQSAPQHLYVFESFAPDVSSAGVREAIQTRRDRKGLLYSVRQYAHRNWLYVSLENC